jgi:hypothetical protein
MEPEKIVQEVTKKNTTITPIKTTLIHGLLLTLRAIVEEY